MTATAVNVSWFKNMMRHFGTYQEADTMAIMAPTTEVTTLPPTTATMSHNTVPSMVHIR